MRLLRRIFPLIATVALVAAVAGFGLGASAAANQKAQRIHSDDRVVLQGTLAGLTKQFLLFAFKEELDVASAGPWTLRPNDPGDKTRLQAYVDRSALLKQGAAIVNLAGTPITEAASAPGLPPSSDPGFEPLRRGLLNGQPGLSSVMHVGDVPMVGLGVPVTIDGTTRAVFVGFFRADKSPLQTYCESLRYGTTGFGSIVDSQGAVVCSGDPTAVGTTLPASPPMTAAAAGKHGFMEYSDHGHKLVASYAPVGLGGWSAQTTQRADEFFGPIHRGQRRTDMAVLALLAAAATGLLVLNHMRQSGLRKSERRFRSLVEHAFDYVTVLDADANILEKSAALEAGLGYPSEDRRGEWAFGFVHPDDQPEVQRIFDEVVAGVAPARTIECRLRHTNGSWPWFEAGLSNRLADPAVRGVVVNMRDVTERKKLQEQLTHLAYHDALTDLPNRAMFQARLQQALARARREGKGVGVLFCDLDRFKIVNDSLGHEVGDHLLVAAAQRIAACLRESDVLARMGGDEFTILIEDLDDVTFATSVAERIIESVREAFEVEGHHVFVTTSVGIAVSERGEDSVEGLLRDADLSMYRAKELGRSRFALFEDNMGARARARLTAEGELRKAWEDRQFEVYYQPEVSLDTGRVVGTEALVRWIHPERGLVPAAHFVPLAEETGLVLPLGRWVLEEACRQARVWHEESPGVPVRMSVNVSGRQFAQDGALVEEVAAILDRTGLDPRLLTVEITESVLVENGETSLATLEAFRALGIDLAIDDFGTGYSSLAYLKHFPVSTLKLDKSFIDGLVSDAADLAIARSVMQLASWLNLEVTAEGIESVEQMRKLRTMGCQRGQGYYFAKPMSAADVEPLLATRLTTARRRKAAAKR